MAAVRPIPTSYYYSGQGRLAIGDRNPTTGEFNNLVYVGNVTSLTVDIAVTKFEHKESMSGQRAIDLTVIQEKNATFSFTAESLSESLLMLGLYGASSSVASGTVASETHKVKLGAAIPLKNPNVSAIVITKGGSSVAEAGNWDYDGGFGVVYVKSDAAGLADDDTVTIAYSYGAHSKIESFTQATPPERYLRFEGLNTTNGDLRLLEIPRAAFDPITGLEFINEELGSGEFNGNILPDLTITGNGLSQYFREKRVKAT